VVISTWKYQDQLMLHAFIYRSKCHYHVLIHRGAKSVSEKSPCHKVLCK